MPVTIDNFQDKVKPNQSVALQKEKNILDDILIKISDNGDIISGIRKKVIEIEDQTPGDDKNTIKLFNMLGEDEINYLIENDLVSRNHASGQAFAVNPKFYNSLKR